jgi:hypothetical protein
LKGGIRRGVGTYLHIFIIKKRSLSKVDGLVGYRLPLLIVFKKYIFVLNISFCLQNSTVLYVGRAEPSGTISILASSTFFKHIKENRVRKS